MGTQWEYSSNLMGVYFDVSIGIEILKDLLSGSAHVIIMTSCYSHVTVLIPSSSPLSAASIAGQNNPAQCNESVLSPLLTGTSLAFSCDPLSIPSGFTNGNKPTDMSPPSITGHIHPHGEDDASDMPPHKHTHPPISEGSLEVFSVPDSPIVHKPGQYCAPGATQIADLSTSSDESILDASTNSSHIVCSAHPPDSNTVEIVDDGLVFLPF